jgi:hypothetical protein
MKTFSFAIAFTSLAACAQLGPDDDFTGETDPDIDAESVTASEVSSLLACHSYDTSCEDAGFQNVVHVSSYFQCGQAFCDGECGKVGFHMGYYSPREYYKVYIGPNETTCLQYFRAPALPIGCGCTP